MIKTDIILNGRYLDLVDDVSMPFTYQIADVKDPSKKNTNFSKTITLPGTATNNAIFGWIWDTNVSVNSSGTTNFTPSFNPNKKADVVIIYDGAEVFKGFMKLDRIKVLADYKIEYDVSCFGKLKDLFLELGEKTMADLDLSKYNHPYTYDTQVASWDNYIYKSGVQVPFNKGDGYVYPMVDYALNNNIDWKTEHFFPAIYYKTIINEIISQAGFKYDGTIFNDNDFKSLVVSYGGGYLKLSNAQIENRTFKASSNTTQIFDTSFGQLIDYSSPFTNRFNNPQTVLFQDDSTGTNYDPGNNYDTISSTFTIPTNGSYKFKTEILLSLTHYPNTSSVYLNQSVLFPQGSIEIVKNGNIILNSTSLWMGEYGYSNNVVPQGEYWLLFTSPVSSGTTSLTTTINLEVTHTFTAGDYVQVFIRRDTGTLVDNAGNILNVYGDNPLYVDSYVRFNLESSSSFQNEVQSVAVSEGDTVDVSSLFGNDIKQKDFISSFFKLFNVYTETDKNDPNLLHFEPRPDFYATSGGIFNWDNKLDYSQNYEVIPMGELDARTYLYKFKDDTDYWNDYYKKKYLQTYGQKKFDIDNDWLTNTNTTEVIFSPTPLVDRAGDDKVLPRIINMNQSGQVVPLSSNANKAANLRLWYYGGVKTTTNSYNYVTSSGTHFNLTSYGYAGHLDDVASPSYDVNFYLPIEVYYTATTYTNNNLFNKYYKQFINEITSKDSRLFKGYFHLNPIDIATLDFRGKFFFHGDYWILNKIYDYNPTEVGKPTLCEFLKLKGGVPFFPTSGTNNGGKDVLLDDDIYPSGNNGTPIDSTYDPDVVVSGSDNVVASTVSDAGIIGQGNSIGEGAKSISILSSSGTHVLSGVRNVTLINSNDLVIDRTYSNSVVIDGQRYGSSKIIWSSGTYTFDGTEQNCFSIFEVTANTTCYLPYPIQIFNGYTIEIKNANDSGYTLTVEIKFNTADDTLPVWSAGDGTTYNQHELTPGDSYRYTYYNNVWYIH